MECSYCKIEFQPKNKKAKYCSAKCRTYAGRGKDKIATDKKSKEEIVVAIPEITEEKEEKDLFYYLEEYERVYLAKNAPSFLEQKKWEAQREKKLEELSEIIERLA